LDSRAAGVNPVALGLERRHILSGTADRSATMAQSSNRFLDDLARLMTDAAGAAQGVRREVETAVKGQIERLLHDMDVANREELDVLRDMVVAAREENQQLTIRMRALEDRLAAIEGAPRGGAGRSESAPGFIE
jgi:BMFP domain-containing protein YqiC